MEKPSFGRMKKGYNRYQVDDYIDALMLERNELQERIEKVYQLKDKHEHNAQELQKLYDTLSENLSTKERAAIDMTRLAMKEANLIVDTAHENAEVIIREALMMARSVLAEIARIGKETHGLKSEMKESIRKLEKDLEDLETPTIPDIDLLDK